MFLRFVLLLVVAVLVVLAVVVVVAVSLNVRGCLGRILVIMVSPNLDGRFFSMTNCSSNIWFNFVAFSLLLLVLLLLLLLLLLLVVGLAMGKR